MDIEHVTDIINKSARIVAHQMRAVEKLKAEGADTTEAERLLAYFWTAHANFENFLQQTITKQEQAAARKSA
jgi:Na+/phosphate symporter